MTKEQREKVWLKYDYRCAYCGKTIEYKNMQVDHIFPKTLKHYLNSPRMKELFGVVCVNIDDFDNLNPACRRCNHYKRSETLEGFRTLLSTLHRRIEKQYINKVGIDYGIIKIAPFDGKFYFEKCKEMK